MPYIMVRSSMYQTECHDRGIQFMGTTYVYGEQNDFRNLETTMSSLGATRLTPTDRSANWCSYKTSQPPFIVLNRLENREYKVVSANAIRDMECIWTLHKA